MGQKLHQLGKRNHWSQLCKPQENIFVYLDSLCFGVLYYPACDTSKYHRRLVWQHAHWSPYSLEQLIIYTSRKSKSSEKLRKNRNTEEYENLKPSFPTDLPVTKERFSIELEYISYRVSVNLFLNQCITINIHMWQKKHQQDL